MKDGYCTACGHCISRHAFPATAGEPLPCHADGCDCQDYRDPDEAAQARWDACGDPKVRRARSVAAAVSCLVVGLGIAGGLLVVARAVL